jgi:hypothetical protein
MFLKPPPVYYHLNSFLNGMKLALPMVHGSVMEVLPLFFMKVVA